MRVTRSQAARSTASTPVKNEPEQQNGTEPRSTRRRTRHSTTSEVVDSDDQLSHHDDLETSGPTNSINSDEKQANGSTHPPLDDHRIDRSGHFEFGGPLGVTLLMIGFPLLMWYMWIGATYYDGRLPLPNKNQPMFEFMVYLSQLVYEGAFPTLKAWMIYWTFIIFEVICYIYLPGVTTIGKPLAHEGGRQLEYHCSGLWSFYTTIVVASGLHLTGLFPLYTLLDEFGPLLSVAIISGVVVSIIAYISALYRGAEHRMSGNVIYDFFMGAELNPRMFGILDFKMFFEVRLPWYMLFLITLAAVARQYEQFGYVSGEVMFLLMAHFLYANACSKGEEYIVPTWDIYYEKWGFMLIFWNMAGVPLSYCHCTIHLANHAPSTYRLHPLTLTFLFTTYLFVYWIWDTTGSQKSRFKQMEHGGVLKKKRWIFDLPWQTLENPKTITSEKGDKILVDGWYGYARKIHYTCDLYFALTWGFITGFESPLPWFYPVFFALMIAHRAYRDIQRCEEKYGDAWLEYKKMVPWLFIPYVF